MALKLRTGPQGAPVSISQPAHEPDPSDGAGVSSRFPAPTWDLRFIHRTKEFFHAVTEPAPLLASALAAPTYLLARNGFLSSLLQAAPGFWTRGVMARATAAAAALPFEILAFSGTARGYDSLTRGSAKNSDRQALLREWGGLGLTLGLFKVHGRIAQSFWGGALAPALGMYSGILHSRLWEHALGWNPIKNVEGLFLDSAKSFLQLRTMAHLSHPLMGPRYGAWMESLEAKAARESPGLNLDRILLRWGEWLQPATPEGNSFAMAIWPKSKKGGSITKDAIRTAAPTPRPALTDKKFVTQMGDLGWNPKDSVELDHFISYFFSQAENQTGRCFSQPTSPEAIKREIPKVIRSLYWLELKPEEQKRFVFDLLQRQRYYSKEILELIPPIVVKMQDDKSPEEILKFFEEVNQKTDQVFDNYAKESPSLAMFAGHGGWDHALNYLKGELPTPMLPPPPSKPPPHHHSLTPIPPPPSQPVIIFTEPRVSRIPLPKGRKAVERVEGPPPRGMLLSPAQLSWEPKILDSLSWNFRFGFWHYKMPPYEAMVSLGKGLSRVPLIDKKTSSPLAEKHALIVRHVEENNQGSNYIIHAHHGDVTVKRMSEVISLGRGEKGEYGERSWLMPGDIVELAPEIEFIFDPQ